jgi:hypothetical protein
MRNKKFKAMIKFSPADGFESRPLVLLDRPLEAGDSAVVIIFPKGKESAPLIAGCNVFGGPSGKEFLVIPDLNKKGVAKEWDCIFDKLAQLVDKLRAELWGRTV